MNYTRCRYRAPRLSRAAQCELRSGVSIDLSHSLAVQYD